MKNDHQCYFHGGENWLTINRIQASEIFQKYNEQKRIIDKKRNHASKKIKKEEY